MGMQGGDLMADVVNFKPRAEIVNEEIVDVLERWLVDAKEGKLTGIAIAGVDIDGMMRYAVPPTNETALLLAVVACIQRSLINTIEDE